MDQSKIGSFISSCRKEKGLTQAQLADMLGISDRAVSKWERGKAMPDSGLMIDLCSALGITVNELLLGQRVSNPEYRLAAESNLIAFQAEKTATDRKLLRIEILLGCSSTIASLFLIFSAIFATSSFWWRLGFGICAAAVFLIGVFICLFIEQKAGYYQCRNCGCKFVPSFRQTVLSMHSGRTRLMRCPKCHKRSWCRKTIQ